MSVRTQRGMQYSTICAVGVLVIIITSNLLTHYRVLNCTFNEDGESVERPRETCTFPKHVTMRGFATSDFQECGGYGTDAISSDGKLVHVEGASSDWSWRVGSTDESEPPHWCRGNLPVLFNVGNGTGNDIDMPVLDADVAMMRKCHANTVRFSVSWAKLQPGGSHMPLDVDEMKRMRARLDTYRKHGMRVIVTVLHFVLPEWFSGWNAEGEAEFTMFMKQLALQFPSVEDENGEEWWVTINEPNIHVIHSYLIGTRPPGKKSFPDAMKAFSSMLRCHVIAAKELRKTRACKKLHASPACNLILFVPARRYHPLECIASVVVDALLNRSILNLLAHGYAYIGTTRIEGETIQNPFIAINQYTRVTIKWPNPLGPPQFDHEIQETPVGHELRNDLNWDVSIKWLEAVLRSVHKFAPSAFVVMTEHGIPDADDHSRCKLVKLVGKLLHDMPYVRGYIHWTFADNIEWELGVAGKFGVCHTDFKNKFERSPRPSYYVIQELWSPASRNDQAT